MLPCRAPCQVGRRGDTGSGPRGLGVSCLSAFAFPPFTALHRKAVFLQVGKKWLFSRPLDTVASSRFIMHSCSFIVGQEQQSALYGSSTRVTAGPWQPGWALALLILGMRKLMLKEASSGCPSHSLACRSHHQGQHRPYCHKSYCLLQAQPFCRFLRSTDHVPGSLE